MSVDWRGLSMAVAQLKEMTEPSKMELMEREYELRAIESQKERAFEESKYLFESNKTDYEENEAEIKRVTENIIAMDASALKLDEQYQSPDFSSLVKKNDLMYKDKLDGVNQNIEQKIVAQTDYLDNISTLYNNMMYGKQIRETQGGDDYNTITKEDTFTLNNDDWASMNENERMSVVDQLNQDDDSKVTTDDWTMETLNQYLENNSMEWQHTTQTEVGWDMDNDGVIMSDEYNAALNDTIKDMEEAGLDTTGIKEGFYSGFNPIENDQGNLDVLNTQISVEQNLEDLKDDIAEEDDDYVTEALKSGEKQTIKNRVVQDNKDAEDRLTAFKDFKKDKALYYGALSDKGTYEEGSDISKIEWETSKKNLKRHLEVLKDEDLELIEGSWKNTNKKVNNPEGIGFGDGDGYGWFNNADFIDNGFDENLEALIHDFDFDELLPIANNMEKLEVQKQLKAEFNWMIENWEYVRGNGATKEARTKFIETYNEFKNLYPDHN